MEENRLNAEYVGEVISETVVTTTTTIYMLIGWERGDMMRAINILLIAWVIFLWILIKSKGRD